VAGAGSKRLRAAKIISGVGTTGGTAADAVAVSLFSPMEAVDRTMRKEAANPNTAVSRKLYPMLRKNIPNPTATNEENV
jgi:hypothetical protein